MSQNNRLEWLEKLQNETFDVLIIGGGINGAGILRDATLRGMKAILFEKGEYASGTSSKSSKLIHGGLRYLETFDWKLVFESCRERRILLNTAPKWVRPLPFLYPVYNTARRSLMEVGAGVWLYDLLATFQNIAHPKIFGKEKTVQIEPRLKREGLKGSALYYDAITNDVQLTNANIQAGVSKGGVAFNECEVIDFIEEGPRISGAIVKDQPSGKTFSIRSKWVVHVTGPWSDAFLTDQFKKKVERLRLTKGVHVVLSKDRFPTERAILLHAPKDGRVTFVIPWENEVLLGTTDTDFRTKDLDHVTASDDDIRYLLEISNFYFPGLKLTPKDILRTFAGLRPLLADNRHTPSQTSREHKIIIESPGLVTMVGGKLTTYRKMSEEVLNLLIKKESDWKGRFQPCATRSTPFHTEIL